jgi:hypothetical protein
MKKQLSSYEGLKIRDMLFMPFTSENTPHVTLW